MVSQPHPNGAERRCSECNCVLARDNRDTMCWPCRRQRALAAQEASALMLRRREAFEHGRIPALAEMMGVDTAEAIRYAVESGILPRRWRSQIDCLIRLSEMPEASHVHAAQALGVSRWTVADWRRQLGLQSGQRRAAARPG
ncbi:MAG TPA: hypothetical protein VKY15_02335 [Acidimicrobiales bacterium]|jgi:hypothetical protein|nr:hypothetical protein [Acidimicrobiales bacterium]